MKKVSVGSALLVLSSVAIAVFNYALSIALSWTLDPAAYGMIGVSQSFIFLGGWFLISGFPWVITQALAKTHPDKIASIYPLLKSAFVGNMLLGGLIGGGLLLAVITGIVPLGADYRLPLAWVAVVIFLLGARLGFDAVLQGRFEFGRLSLVRSVEVMVQFGLALLLVWRGYGVSGALAGFALGTALSLGVAGWLVRKVDFWQVYGFGSDALSALRPALPFLLANLCGVILVNVDLLAVKFLTPPAQADALAGQYQVAVVLARIPYFLSQSIITIIFPLVVRYADNPLQANQIGRQALQFIISVALGLSLILIAAPEATIAFFFPIEYLAAAPALRLLAVAVTLIILAQALGAILQARGQAAQTAGALLVAAVTQILALLWSVPQFETMGASLATALAGLVALGAMLLVTRRTFPALIKLSPQPITTQIVAIALLGIVVASLPLLDRFYTALWISAGISVYTAILFILWRDKIPHYLKELKSPSL